MLFIVYEKINGSCFYFEINVIMYINRELFYYYVINFLQIVDIYGDFFLQLELNLY